MNYSTVGAGINSGTTMPGDLPKQPALSHAIEILATAREILAQGLGRQESFVNRLLGPEPQGVREAEKPAPGLSGELFALVGQINELAHYTHTIANRLERIA
jgi:hypothetical protein